MFRGEGPPPGYLWTVLILDLAFDVAMKLLNEAQYKHVALQIKQLAKEADPTHSQTASVEQIEDFFELKDKGGILGKINLRVFFHVDKDTSSLVVLGAIKKQNEGPTPQGDKIRMRRRKRKYVNGEFEDL